MSALYDFNKDLESMKKSRDYTGKVALVTGSSSGIGEGIVKVLASLGAQVVIHGRNVNDLQTVAEEAKKLSPKNLEPLQVVGDLGDDQTIERLINETVSAFGRLDILVNNAGVGANAKVEDPKFITTFDLVHRIDLRAPALLNHLAAPHLKATKGNIIHISSDLAMHPLANMCAYNVAKAGMDMMTRCLAIELGPHGVRVNTINPGITDTNFRVAGMDFPPKGSAIREQMVQPMIAKTPLRRIGQPLDIARGVAFLASSDASFITGANLLIDGGLIYTLGGRD